jgi:hypothetical protein
MHRICRLIVLATFICSSAAASEITVDLSKIGYLGLKGRVQDQAIPQIEMLIKAFNRRASAHAAEAGAWGQGD